MKNFIIYLSVLLISNIYAQCDDYSQAQCSNDNECDWIEDIDWGSCEDLDPIWNVAFFCDDLSTNSDNCYTYTCYGGGYGQWNTCCGGDPYIIADNSYCEEVEMPECSEMGMLQCNFNDSCNWVDDIEIGNCSAFSNENCINQEGCFLDQDCNQWGSWYSWICYDYGPVYCSGNYQQDNSYCEENQFQLGDANFDNIINVLDVIEIINLVLYDRYEEIADINEDSEINVLDIIEIVGIILNGDGL